MNRNRKLTAAMLVVIPIAGFTSWVTDSDPGARKRSFFGVITIDHSPDGAYRRFAHGTTFHGAEAVADVSLQAEGDPRPEPLTYYSSAGPMAEAIALKRQAGDGPVDIGVVGLGVGSLACYSKSGDDWTFFEIDPAVVAFARDRNWFNYLSRCTPDAKIVVGDARLTVQDEAEGKFDILVIDAFSSDAVPAHLLTREAVAGYFKR